MSEAAQGLEVQAKDLASQAALIVVADGPSFEAAAECLRGVKSYLRRVAEVFDPIISAAHRAHKVAVEQRKRLEVVALDAERALKAGMAEYERETARRAEEAARAAEQERERLEAEARTQAEIEQQRIRAEAEERRLDAAIAAEEAGDSAKAERLLAAPVLVPVVAPAPVFMAAPQASSPKAAGIAFRTDWDFEIIDAAAIPRTYLIPDVAKLRGLVRATRGTLAIPGVRIFEKRVTIVKS